MKSNKITEEELDSVALMIMNGISLRKIVKITNINKSSIYRRFPNVKTQKFNPIQIQSFDEELIGEFIGVFAGDGCFYKENNGNYKISLYFNIKEEKYVNELRELLCKLFGKYPMQTREHNKIILKYYSKNIYLLIREYLDWNETGRKTHSVCLKENTYSREFKIGFLRGSLDSDGYFTDKSIMFASSSKRLMENAITFLTDLNVPCQYYEYVEKRPNRVNMHHVNIRKPDRERFIELINPRERKNIKSAPAGIFLSLFRKSLGKNKGCRNNVKENNAPAGI